jgi:lincosamide and streptogramin A transport system ATP-binding/permease protein
VECRDFSLGYRSDNDIKPILEGITFQLMQGDILFLNGENGCGKSSLIKAILNDVSSDISNMVTSGKLETASGLVISYINQNTSHLSGSLKEYAKKHNLDYSIFLTLLRKLDMSRVQFEKNIEEYSEGQKKKVLIAASLLQSAHIYIWDEPMNYIDVFSRMQIEALIERFKPTMIVVEHDVRFREKLASKVLDL